MAYSTKVKHQTKKLRKKGYSLNEIAQEIGVSKNSASRWVRDLKLSPQAQKILDQKNRLGCFSSINQPTNRPPHIKNTKWTPEKLQKIKQLYDSGLSVKDVAQKLGHTHGAINNAMRRNNIPRRTAAQTNKIKFYNSPFSFTPKQNLTTQEEKLKVAGLMLYWAEGFKKNNEHVVDFANSDSKMIKLFCKFLRKIYQIEEEKLSAYIYCYPSHNIKKLIKYWSNLTQIPSNQFTKPYIRSDGGQIRDKMKHGLLHIRYFDKRLIELIMKEIRLLSYNL